ncbi:trimethylamine methyltransferase family protein [Mesorhizobium sp. M1169]
MLGGMRAFCRSPFVLGGANTPASTAAAVAQLNAEAPRLSPTRRSARRLPRDLWALPVDRVDAIGSANGGNS